MTATAAHPPASWNVRLQRVAPALACPHCRGALVFHLDGAGCVPCARHYPYRDGKLYFIEGFTSHDPLDKIKETLKRRFGKLFYTLGITLVAPTFPFSLKRAMAPYIDPAQVLVVDIGSGNHRVDDHIIAVDGMNYPEVDLVADITALPFHDGSVDGFVSRSLLEHVWPLESAVSELKRCTRAGGVNLHLIPFLFPFHASPYDFQRLTHAGAARLFDDWTVLRQYNATGPVTFFLVGVIEFLSVTLSLGLQQLKAPLYLLLCLLLFPLKFLDAPFVGRRVYMGMAPTIVTVVRKPGGSGAS